MIDVTGLNFWSVKFSIKLKSHSDSSFTIIIRDESILDINDSGMGNRLLMSKPTSCRSSYADSGIEELI